jgi:hypothetical protein
LSAGRRALADRLGVWTLGEFIVHREDGADFNWPGPQRGTLIYTAEGYVSVAQNRDPLPDASEADQQRVANFYTARLSSMPSRAG